MKSSSRSGSFKPRIIIHGGAGSIQPANLPPDQRKAYKTSLLRILAHGNNLLQNGTSALEAATSTVALFEDDPLFNCGHGAVFNRAGEIELEASVMVSAGYKKQCAAVSLLRHVKNPILLAKTILERGEEDMEGSSADVALTAQGHVHLSGAPAEGLAKAYGLMLKPQSYFWTRKRWEEHKRGLSGKEATDGVLPSTLDHVCEIEDISEWEVKWHSSEHLPQGTVGCVAADENGVICVATSTGGLTNKLPGRIGDTPTVGAGFWAEEGALQSSDLTHSSSFPAVASLYGTLAPLATFLPSPLTDCLPIIPRTSTYEWSMIPAEKPAVAATHALALSGTGNGDSFLRVAACRTAAALALPPQISIGGQLRTTSGISLSSAVTAITGPGGILQRSAGDRWGKTGEGQGGIIGIERRGNESDVVFDMNGSSMFRAYIDNQGRTLVGIFRGDDEIVHNS